MFAWWARMRTFTAVLPTQLLLPMDLALLLAPVRVAEPSAPDTYVGRADGVLLDDEGRVVAFIVRLTKAIDARGARTLVPVTALHMTPGPKLPSRGSTRISSPTAASTAARPWRASGCPRAPP
jgi:hypothetical protein